MEGSQRQLFRERAIQRYMQRQQADVLPRFLSLRLFCICWLVLALFMLALIGFLLVFGRVMKG